MAVARAKPGLHVNHGRRGGWSTDSPPLASSLLATCNSWSIDIHFNPKVGKSDGGSRGTVRGRGKQERQYCAEEP
jgi:hypothetical protein